MQQQVCGAGLRWLRWPGGGRSCCRLAAFFWAHVVHVRWANSGHPSSGLRLVRRVPPMPCPPCLHPTPMPPPHPHASTRSWLSSGRATRLRKPRRAARWSCARRSSPRSMHGPPARRRVLRLMPSPGGNGLCWAGRAGGQRQASFEPCAMLAGTKPCCEACQLTSPPTGLHLFAGQHPRPAGQPAHGAVGGVGLDAAQHGGHGRECKGGWLVGTGLVSCPGSRVVAVAPIRLQRGVRVCVTW